MTPEQLAEIKARAEAATYNGVSQGAASWAMEGWGGRNIIDSCNHQKDAAFIAHSHTDILALIAEIERLNSGIDTLLNRWRDFAKEPCVKAHVRQLVSDMADDLEFATKDGER